MEGRVVVNIPCGWLSQLRTTWSICWIWRSCHCSWHV